MDGRCRDGGHRWSRMLRSLILMRVAGWTAVGLLGCRHRRHSAARWNVELVSPSRAYRGPGLLIVGRPVTMGRGQMRCPATALSGVAVCCWRDADPAWWLAVRRVLTG